MYGTTVFLLLTTVIIVVSSDDKFIFNVSFTCGYHQRESYSYNVQIFERDHWPLNGNDAITSQKIGKAHPGLSRFTMEGWQRSDEQFSKGYEPIIRLYHDCTEYKREAEVTLNITPSCEFGKGVCHYNISKDIKDLAGEFPYKATLTYE
ncbi:TransThyretin-Related family domain [Caenorhabditis elegans]|uniref:TransThyretin-Related family domain n=1 Tax=Caenorhabditis elegans TaxID=6239 RepID=A0A5K1IB90_CAEEL|nr:TransThyretin-Related family domain [Caenorhabditis elegans]VWL57894.1 TransThyretin-Related family domain [Caenorhabditis elegans]